MSYNLPFKDGDEIVELGGGEQPVIREVPGLRAVNVDKRDLPEVDIIRDLDGDFSDIGVFDGVFAKYLAEHISWRNTASFFENCFKILRPGGVAVFIVPDTYEQMRKILEKPPEEITFDDSCLLFGGQDYPDNTHKVLFSKPFLTKLLEDVGFSDVKIFLHPNPEARDIIVEAHRKKDATILVGATADLDTKINFGSFTVTFGDGWINADIRADIKQFVENKGHIFEYCNVTEPMRWEDNSVSLVVAHHLIEHLSRGEGSYFLRECYRILKPGGVIRLSTPDLDVFVDHHKAGSFRETYSEEYEVKHSEDGADAFFRLAFMGHKTIYTFPTLRQKMESINFREVKKMPYGASRSSQIMLETEDSFPDHSFYIEAEKGLGVAGLKQADCDGLKIFYRDVDNLGSPDLSIITDLYTRQAFSKKVFALPENAVVVDLGAHIGAYSLLVKNRRPDLKVYAVEPLPDNVEILRKNISENNMDIAVLPIAVCGSSGMREMWVHDFNAGSNTLSKGEFDCHPLEYHTKIEVQCVDLAELMNMIGEERIDLLKVDIQGEEYPLMEYMLAHPEVTAKIRRIDMEFHPLNDYYDQANPLAIRMQDELGYLLYQTGRDTGYFYFDGEPRSSVQKAKPLEDYQRYLLGELNGKPKVSIVIPTVDAPIFYECIEKVKANTTVDAELIIVCDDPDQDKEGALKQLEDEGTVVITNRSRVGYPRATNQGMRRATGDFVLIMNDDVLVETEGWLQQMVDVLKRHPEFGFVSPIVEREGKRREEYFAAIGECSLLSRELIERVGFLDESEVFRFLCSDGDYYVRVVRAGYKPHGVPGVTVTHTAGQTIRSELTEENQKAPMDELERRYGDEIHVDQHLIPAYEGEAQ